MADSDIPTLKSTLFTLQEVNSRYFNLDFDVRFRLPTIFAEYKLRNLHPFPANRVSSVMEFVLWIRINWIFWQKLQILERKVL